MNKLNILFSICIICLLSACASSGVNRVEKETTINISYARVIEVEAVQFKSEAGKNAAVGGLWGLVSGSQSSGRDAVGGAVAGALLMGLTTKIVEGSRDGFAYTMERKDKSAFKVVTDDKHVKIGDCVAVETGRTTNIRVVSQEMCGPDINHPVEAHLKGKHLEDAAVCDAAKQELLKANTDADINASMKKVKVLCH